MNPFVGAFYPAPETGLPNLAAIFRSADGKLFVVKEAATKDEAQRWLDAMLGDLNNPNVVRNPNA